MTHDNPPRLKSSSNTPAELAQALEALGRDRDAARLARVAERLGPSMASGATAAGRLSSVSGSKLVLIGLAVGVGAAGVLGYAFNEQRSSVQDALPPRRAVAPAPQPDVRTTTALENPSAGTADQPSAVERASASPHPGRASTSFPREGVSRGSTSSRAAPAFTPHTGVRDSNADTAPTSTPAPAPANSREVLETPSQPAREHKQEPEHASSAEPVSSELSLLRKARADAQRTPEQALRLLNEHAKRYPNGMLVPERELLVIEVLRKLGRNVEADQRQREFEARYPRSLHLRRLERDAAPKPR